MAKYDKPTKTLMAEWAKSNLQPGMFFTKAQPVTWFRANYPLIKSNTVEMQVESMSVNNPNRKHHPGIKESGHDLFYKEGPGRFRLLDLKLDPAPRYKAGIEAAENGTDLGQDDLDEIAPNAALPGETFAYEKDLQNYLARNLHHLEPGLKLYEEEGLTASNITQAVASSTSLQSTRTGSW